MGERISDTEYSLRRSMAKAIRTYNMIEPHDRVMVAVSGGKDSYTLLHLLHAYRRRSPFPFELIAVHLDQVQPGYDGRPLVEYLEAQGYPYEILRQDTYSVVVDKVPEGKTYCSLCSRLRRGILYSAAVEMGITKIALGHHRDDLLETFLLNLFFSGQLKTMPPKLLSDDGRNVVIRPLALCREAEIEVFAGEQAFPILPCNLCGSQEGLKRQSMKTLLAELESRFPDVSNYMTAALGNVRSSHLPNPALWRALGLAVAGTLDGDPAAGRPGQRGRSGPPPEPAPPSGAPRVLSDAQVAEELGF